MKNLIILTESFPYQGGEQFIESEVNYWAETDFNKVYIVPNSSSTKNIRHYPDHLIVLQRPKINYISKVLTLFFIFFYSLFWKELFYLINNRKINFLNLFNIIKVVFRTKIRLKQLERSIQNIDGDIMVYSYWNDLDFFAACELKRKKLINKVVSRAHGYDCYEERRINNYMPLKRQYNFLVDRVFLLSDSALNYFHEKYNFDLKVLSVSRLGVQIPNEKKLHHREKNIIRVLSISNCIPIKRIDKIIDSLNMYSSLNKIHIEWSHIGSGILFQELKIKSHACMLKNNYLKTNFLGFMPNIDVKKNLDQCDYDLFINASESEGVPVSIMEAMSYSIPVIAPNVGGIADIVTTQTGCLLNSNPEIEDFVIAIEKLLNLSTYKKYRLAAYNLVSQNYNSNRNYELFIKELSQIADE